MFLAVVKFITVYRHPTTIITICSSQHSRLGQIRRSILASVSCLSRAMKGESPSACRDDGEETRAYQKLRVDQLKVAEEALRRYSVKGVKGERNGSGVSIVWFRNDLRILDNEALYRAWKSSETVLPVYCIDPRLFNGTTHYFGFPKTGELRAQFLLESLADLKENLLNRGLNLLIKFGKPEEVLLDIVQSVGAHTVYAHKETCSEEVLVERHVSKSLETITLSSGGSTSSNSHHPTLQLVWGSTMYHLLDLPFKPEYIPDVYTEFRKAVESKCKVRPCYKLPSSLGPFPKNGVDDLDGWGKVPTLDQLGLSAKDQSSLGVVHFIGGESAALARVHEYFWEKDLLPHYKETRNGMLGLDYSTKFSPWLAFGSLSPRYIHEEVKRYESERVANASTYWILFELIWRDYFRFISIKYGSSIFHLGGPRRIKEIQWSQDPTLFQLWRNGQTGYPLIDANMKELSATGFMSNRGRQIVCSFLVRDMGLDWRMGAEWFETCLLDYDPCSNYGNWTYGAGVGNDPREDRYFSIRKQAQSYDPDGKYVAHWLPDIAKLPREMPLLQKVDALSLFCFWAFGQPSIPTTEDEDLVKMVEAECKGLPLALKVIASSLRGEPRPVWENAKKKLSRGQSISEYHRDELFHCLETSIDVLDDESKQCFLDLGAFPKGRKFSADALLDIWVYTRGMEWQDAFVVLLELASRNLLNLTSDPGSRAISFGCSSELSFSQHDVMRDLAFRLANQDGTIHCKRLFMPSKEDNIPTKWLTLKDQASKAQFVSIHTGPMEEQNWCEMNFPEVEVLALFFAASRYCLPTFLHTMPKLKVAIIYNYSSKRSTLHGLPTFPAFPQIKSVLLGRLIVSPLYEYCRSSESLEKLSVVLCEGLGNMTLLDKGHDIPKSPKFQEMSFDHCSDLEELPGNICNLTHLQKLSVTDCHLIQKLPDDFGRLRSLGVLRLSACPSLSMLPPSICELQQLEFLDISLCRSLKDLPMEFDQLSNLKVLDMRECSGLKKLPKALAKLRSLRCVICDESTERQWLAIKASTMPNLIVEVIEERFTLDWLDD